MEAKQYQKLIQTVSSGTTKGSTIKVFVYLLARADDTDKNGFFSVRQVDMSKDMKMTRPLIIDAVNELKEIGVLQVEKFGVNNLYKFTV